MPEKNKRSFEIILAIIFFLSLCGIALIGSNPFLHEPGRDGGFFMYAGRQILQGKLLYIDVWDSKGPLIFYINAFGLWLGKQMRWGIWTTEMLFLVGSSLMGFILMKRKWRTTTSLFGVIVFLLGFKQLIANGNFTEEYSLLFTWIAIFAFSQLVSNPSRRLDLAMLGAMFALNFLNRANNIGTSAALILIWTFVSSKKLGVRQTAKNATFIFLGIIMVSLPILGYHAYLGSFDELMAASFFYNFSYSFSTRPSADNFNILKASLIPGYKLIPAEMTIAFLGFMAALHEAYRGRKARREWGWFAMMIICWPIELIASSISGRGHGHYFISWLPALALLASQCFDYVEKYLIAPGVTSLLNEKKPYLAFGLGIIIVLYCFQTDVGDYLKTGYNVLFFRHQGIEKNNPVSIFISKNTRPDEKVLVWGGQSGINLMSDRDSSTAFLFYPSYSNTSIGTEIQKRYFDDLVEKKPQFIIDASIHAPDEIPSLDPDTRSHQRLLYPIANNVQEVMDYINTHYDVWFDIAPYKVYKNKTIQPGDAR